LNKYREIWRRIIRRAVEAEAGRALDAEAAEAVVAETPPRPEMGDLAFPMFPFARLLRRPPQAIASAIAVRVAQDDSASGQGRIELQGPYLNLHLPRPAVVAEVLGEILRSEERYGGNDTGAGRRAVVEFSCPNTNKPLHLGHLRNDAIGMSVARLLEACATEVFRVNLINDRGVHICKSMLAYQRFGGGATPEAMGQKSDHLVGDYYVRFASWAKDHPEAEEEARSMLKAWEEGDSSVRELWQLMNRWAIEGIEQTYRKTGVSFDKVYLESETYLLGREAVLEGLERGVFAKQEDGSIWVDLSEQGLDRKVLLRSDGTSLYVTQDVGTAIQRSRDWPFDRMIYVVGNEQRHHFQVLFKVLELLGHPWAGNLHHLAYGMVNLPEGKMKSREGIVVDADDLVRDLEALAVDEIRAKDREAEIEDLAGTAEKIALGALNYYLLQPSPYKDMIFDPRESISFSGSTGPYLQYTGARICSMLRKYEQRKEGFREGSLDVGLLCQEGEWRIIKLLAGYPDAVLAAARDLNPSSLTAHLFDLAQAFSTYYHDNPVLHNADANLVVSRITLSACVLQALRNGMSLIGVPFLERM
jgi:arginyl-tRNA synthetase